MSFKKIVFTTLFLLCSSVALAQKADVSDLVARMPEEVEVVLASPNLPEALAGLRQWIGTLDDLPEGMQQSVGIMLDRLESVSGGAVAVGLRTENSPTFLGFAVPTDAPDKVLQALLEYGRATDARTIAFGPQGREWGFCSVRNGLLVFGSSSASVLNEYAVEPEAGFLADRGVQWLLKHPDVAKADLFVLKKAGEIAAFSTNAERWGKGNAASVTASIMNRISNALGLNAIHQAPSVAMLNFQETGFALSILSLKRIPDENDKPESSLHIDQLDAAFDKWPIRLEASGLSFDDLVGAVEAAETRFDLDVGAEFNEEMAELDRDLGLSFRKDFLGSLGDDWALLVRQEEGSPEWALWSEVSDAKAFLNGAQSIAKLAEEPWLETLNWGEGGSSLVNTNAFGVPLTIAVYDREMAVGSRAEAVHAACQSDKPDADGDKTPFAQVRAVVGLRMLGEMLEQRGAVGGFGSSWTTLPTDATIQFDFTDLDYVHYASLSLKGVPTRNINFFLVPFLFKMRKARDAAQAQACSSNMGQILKASFMYQGANNDQWPPNVQALFPKYLDNERVLVCPATGNGPSYRFFGDLPFKLAGPMCPVVYDLKGNHPDGRNVGFFDGHVRFYNEAAFEEMLRDQFQRLNNSINQAIERGEKVDVDMKTLNDFFTDFGTIQ